MRKPTIILSLCKPLIFIQIGVSIFFKYFIKLLFCVCFGGDGCVQGAEEAWGPLPEFQLPSQQFNAAWALLSWGISHHSGSACSLQSSLTDTYGGTTWKQELILPPILIEIFIILIMAFWDTPLDFSPNIDTFFSCLIFAPESSYQCSSPEFFPTY